MMTNAYDAVADFGELYDHVALYTSRHDIEFYVACARRMDGPILELGCGTGRVLVPIARTGATVCGLDQSVRMLQRCREKVAVEPAEIRDRIRLIAGDVRAFDVPGSFGAAFMPFRVFQHMLTVADQLACLASVHRHLKPGGALVFDVFCPDLARIASPSGDEVDDTPETPLLDGRRFRRTSRVATVSRVEQWSEIELIYYVTGTDGVVDRRVHAFQMRWFLRYELEHLLARCGFATREFLGDFDGSPLVDGSPEIVVIAERR
jgi:SAM-dependent methyltransferase